MSKRNIGGHFITREQVANARRNIQRYDWAAAERDAAVERAQRWLAFADEALWDFVTEQAIPRSTEVNLARRCPACDEGIRRAGGRFIVEPLETPWKAICPNCGARFPTNDFSTYYRSGRGPDSFFDSSLADRSLLYNSDHPDPRHPLHKWGVDNGTGWTDEQGEVHRFVALCNHYRWYAIAAACRDLSEAFLFTGDTVFARKAGLLVARIADVYPAMNWAHWAQRGFFHNDGGDGVGRIFGRIHEPRLLLPFAKCYDAVQTGWRNHDPMFDFLRKQQFAYNLPEQDAIDNLCRHFDDRVLRIGIEAVLKGQIARNEPGDQVTVAALALALDDEQTRRHFDWVFRPGYRRGRKPSGGHIPQLFASEIDRDGFGSEGSPGYSLGWLFKAEGMRTLDRVISAKPDYARHSIGEFVRYRQMFRAPVRLICLGRYVPGIGDFGSTGRPALCDLTLDQCVDGFELFDDPLLARAAHFLAGGDASKLHGSIFDAEPEAVRERIERVVAERGPLRLTSDLLTGYGLALLRDGADDVERTLWLYYGRNGGHGHLDRLNLGLYGFGLDLLPDLGYPEHSRTWPKRFGWTHNTVSHNTVVVDGKAQGRNHSGKVRCFATSPLAQVVGVSSPEVYRACSRYDRTSAMIRISEEAFYVVDLFHVAGGESHHLSFHAAEGETTTDGLKLKPQPRGTYAGEDVAFGKFYDGEKGVIRGYRGSGFQYLYDVQRCAKPESVAAVEWRIKDTWQVTEASRAAGEPVVTDIRLRWTLLNAPGEVAVCRGEPPQTRPGNPEWLQYIIAAHEGPAPVESGFLSVIEAWSGERCVKRIEELQLRHAATSPACRAVAVHLRGGMMDTLFFGDGETRLETDTGIVFDGIFGVFRTGPDETGGAFLVGGTVLGTEERALRPGIGMWKGTVTGREAGVIRTNEPIPDDLNPAGLFISVTNDSDRDASYRIKSVCRDKGTTFIDVGENNFVRGMVDNLDYAKGHQYDFEPGQPFRVVLTAFREWS